MRLRRLDCSVDELTGDDLISASEAAEGAAHESESDTEAVENLLLDNGCTFSQIPRLLGPVAEFIEERATVKAAEAMRHICMRLGDTAAGVALRTVLLGDEGKSTRELGEEAGTSHMAVVKQQKRARAMIGYTPGT